MLMNALKVLTNVTLTPSAATPREGTTALVKTDTPEMDNIAKVCFLSAYSILYVEGRM